MVKGVSMRLGALRRVSENVPENVLARKVDINTSKEFAQDSQDVCSNINVIYVSQDNMKPQFSKLDSSWSPGGVQIYGIPGTQSAHYFQALSPYTLKMALTAAQRESNPTYFSFKNGSISNPSPAPQSTVSAPVHDASTPPGKHHPSQTKSQSISMLEHGLK